MTARKLDGLFLAITLLIPLFHHFIYPISIEAQWWILGIVLITTGIPHGAIDHLIYINKKKRTRSFYLIYLVVAIIIALVWLFFPSFALATFFILTALHFGQSQLYHYPIKETNILKMSAYLFWGITLLWTYIAFQPGQAYKLFDRVLKEEASNLFFMVENADIVLYVSGTLFLLIQLYYIFSKKINFKLVLIETIYLAVLVLLFITTPGILAFAIYFGLWHSGKTMFVEFTWLHKDDMKLSIRSFMKKIMPYVALSFLAFVVAFFVFKQYIADLSLITPVFILISVLTFPHSWVMTELYKRNA